MGGPQPLPVSRLSHFVRIHALERCRSVERFKLWRDVLSDVLNDVLSVVLNDV